MGFPTFSQTTQTIKTARRAGGTPASPPSESLILSPGAGVPWEFHHLMWIEKMAFFLEINDGHMRVIMELYGSIYIYGYYQWH